MTFNEDSRVKLPAILQFRRLGYIYQSKKNQNIQKHNNIFVDVFKSSIREINGKDYSDEQLDDTIKQIETLTDNRRDKGKGFYDRLKAYHDMMLVNLEEPEKNDFRVKQLIVALLSDYVHYKPMLLMINLWLFI